MAPKWTEKQFSTYQSSLTDSGKNRIVSLHVEKRPSRPDADLEAAAIGVIYNKAKKALTDSLQYAWECGQRLLDKKESLPHGSWLRWLKDNEEVLGFEERAAQRFMAFANANPSLTTILPPEECKKLISKLWQNERSLESALKAKSSTPTVEIIETEGEDEEETPVHHLKDSMRVRGLFNRAQESKEMAEADNLDGIKVTKKLIEAVSETARAWIELLEHLELKGGSTDADTNKEEEEEQE